MTLPTLDKLIWTLIYGGLIGVAIGLAVERSDAALGWGFVSGGAATSLVGVILIYVRSRKKDNP
ncbi:hypothetical protein [Piscinibacter sp.]|uniref:hypothetical protein n=1 Tax=Piscinibacter sp. TaxID=1903157 RepID=UPI002B74755F|nr:hypothetical protein [Albitalea sp.]HUG20947.1 hypothetical protein [Albitalea sp.]